MFKRKKKKTGIETPEFRKSTPPPKPPKPPTSGSNAFKPSPVAVLPNDISTVVIMCKYETPCGWCCKWDKKCEKKIGCGDDKPKRGLRAKANMYDDAITFSYGKCLDCKYDAGCDKECNPENNFKYFQSKEN